MNICIRKFGAPKEQRKRERTESGTFLNLSTPFLENNKIMFFTSLVRLRCFTLFTKSASYGMRFTRCKQNSSQNHIEFIKEKKKQKIATQQIYTHLYAHYTYHICIRAHTIHAHTRANKTHILFRRSRWILKDWLR